MRTIRRTEKQHGTEIMVVTLDTIGAQSPKQFATALFNEWGIGPASKNNGVLVLVVKDARRIEVEVGRALNSRFDRSFTERMLANAVLPHFRAGDYSEGLVRSVDALSQRFNRGFDWETFDWETTLWTAGLYIGLPAAIGVSRIVDDRRQRTCDACGAVTDRRSGGVGAWRVTREPGYQVSGLEERNVTCATCGSISVRRRSIKAYDGRRRGRNGDWIYYYRETSSSSDADGGGGGSSDGGGGGGGSW